MYTAYLGLGSNRGDRVLALQRAVDALRNLGRVVKVSSVYETEPSGMTSANMFYNMAVMLETTLDPPALLRNIKQLERELGRSPDTHMKDREIDLDILLYRNLYYEDDDLQVPHPLLASRRFALEPLHELASTEIHPLLGVTIATLLSQCTDTAHVQRLSLHIS